MNLTSVEKIIIKYMYDQIVENKITQAMQRGDFNNLPRAGRPLVLDDDNHIAPDLRVGYRILKNSGFCPPEIGLRREIADVRQLISQTINASDCSCKTKRLNALLLQLAVTRG